MWIILNSFYWIFYYFSVVPMPSNELKTDFFGLSSSSSSNTAVSTNPTSFLPPPPMPPPDLGDYTSSLSYGHMTMVNHFYFWSLQIKLSLFIIRLIPVVWRIHYRLYVLVYITHLKIHHVLVQQHHTESLMNELTVFHSIIHHVYVFMSVVLLYSIKKQNFFCECWMCIVFKFDS